MEKLNGLDVIRRGYNLFKSEYPNGIGNLSTGDELVHLTDPENTVTETYLGVDYEVPVGVSFVPNPTPARDANTAVGSDQSEYTQQLALSVGASGSYGLFSASMEMNYGSSISVESSTYYASCIETGQAYTLGFHVSDVDKTGDDPNKNFKVSDSLKAAFDELEIDDDGSNAREFFDFWGTHVVSGISMGGQTSFSMYGSSEYWETTQDFEGSAEAKYGTVSGSTSFDYSSSSSEEHVESNQSLFVTGGDTGLLSTDQGDENSTLSYDEWFNSIQGNEAWYGFTQDGLSRISSFCNDASKQEYLDNVYFQLSGETSLITYSNPNEPEQYTMSYKDSPGATEGEFLVHTKDQALKDTTYVWNAASDEVLAGIGFGIDSDHHLKRMVVITLNLTDMGYNSYFFGNGDDESKWQAYCMAPKGGVITGFGVSQKSKSLSHLIMYYQNLNICDQTQTFLEPTIRTRLATGSDSQTINFNDLPMDGCIASMGGSSSIEEYNRSATPNFPPEEGNQKVITGFAIHAAKNSEPNKGFDYLTTNFADLEIVDNTTTANLDEEKKEPRKKVRRKAISG